MPDGRRVEAMHFASDWIADRVAAAMDRHEARAGYSMAFVYTVATARPLHDGPEWFAALRARAHAFYPDALADRRLQPTASVGRALISSPSTIGVPPSSPRSLRSPSPPIGGCTPARNGFPSRWEASTMRRGTWSHHPGVPGLVGRRGLTAAWRTTPGGMAAASFATAERRGSADGYSAASLCRAPCM